MTDHKHRIRRGLWVAACVGLTGTSAFGNDISLSHPVDCTLGRDCYVQNYVDLDPSDGVQDFRCGGATYDGHKGTDFRLLSTREAKKGVAVLAAAPGIVKALRDNMPDRLIGNGVNAPAGRECGNGVVIDHGGGWVTQYCHLRRGSVSVQRGQIVERGARLGSVGYSGKAAFAHLHFSVRRNGKHLDPYTSRPLASGCARTPGRSLWQPGTTVPAAGPRLIEAGFAPGAVTPRQTETAAHRQASVTPRSTALVFFARFMNLRVGDQISLRMQGPGGFRTTSQLKPLTRNKAQFVAYTGRRLKAARWAPGTYIGKVRLTRNGKVVRDDQVELELP